MTTGGFQHWVNRRGVKEAQTEGKVMILAIAYTRLREAEEGGLGKGGNPMRSERD